jgi:Leucine-rich repeat (LRR) protein
VTVGRTELIARATGVLLDSRDRERGLIPPHLENLRLSHRRELLGDIALWMFMEGASTISLDSARNSSEKSALDIVAETLKRYPTLSVTADEVLAYLLDRAFVLQRTSAHEGQFAHRLFLEYLAADRIVESGRHGQLMSAKGKPGWYVVAAFYCALARDHESAAFIGSIVEQIGSGRGAEMRRMVFCLAECLGGVTAYPSEYLDRAKALLGHHLPPRDSHEAALLASVGESVIDLLKEPETPAEAALYVQTAARVRGGHALELLAIYARGPFAGALREALVEAWASFPGSAFADKVLAQLELSGVDVGVTNGECLVAASRIPSLRRLSVSCRVPDEGLVAISRCDALEALDLEGARSLGSLKGIEALKSLKHVRLPRMGGISDIGPLGAISTLESIYCGSAKDIKSLAPISLLPRLKRLYIEAAPVALTGQLRSGFSQLQYLSIDRCQCQSLEFLAAMPRLEFLSAHIVTGVSDSQALGGHLRIRRVAMTLADNHSFLCLPRNGQLVSLELRGRVSLMDLLPIGERRVGVCGSLLEQRMLRCLIVDGHIQLRGLRNLRPLGNCLQLEELHLSQVADLRTLEGIEWLRNLKHLGLTGGNLRSLSGEIPPAPVVQSKRSEKVSRERMPDEFSEIMTMLPASPPESAYSIGLCAALESLNLDGNTLLESVRELMGLDSLKRLSVQGATPAYLDELPGSIDIQRDMWDVDYGGS